jgi:hypothetical protein
MDAHSEGDILAISMLVFLSTIKAFLRPVKGEERLLS